MTPQPEFEKVILVNVPSSTSPQPPRRERRKKERLAPSARRYDAQVSDEFARGWTLQKVERTLEENLLWASIFIPSLDARGVQSTRESCFLADRRLTLCTNVQRYLCYLPSHLKLEHISRYLCTSMAQHYPTTTVPAA